MDLAVTGTDLADDPAWRTAAATGLGYAVVLAILFVLLFVVPFLVVLAL